MSYTGAMSWLDKFGNRKDIAVIATLAEFAMSTKKTVKGKASDGRTVYVKLSPRAWSNLQSIQNAIGNLSITATIELALHTTAERYRSPTT